MSGGFFRGTSADQDTRFSNKQAKLLKSQKFAAELENLVDMTKVKMDVMRPWIAKRVTELIGFEDEVLINFIYGLLEGKAVNGKQIQISLTGFMERNTGKFMKELWALLLSAQQNMSGVPQQFLDAKEEETKNKKAETDRIANEIQRKKEREKQEIEQEKTKMDGDGAKYAGLELDVKHDGRDSSIHPADEKERHKRNGLGRRDRSSQSPDSAYYSPSPRRKLSASPSKSSNSRSHSERRSRVTSRAPPSKSRSISSEGRRRSSPRRSVTPRRRPSIRRSRSPWRRSLHSRRRSTSGSRRRSPSPVRYRVRSPQRYRSRSPLLRRSRSPVRRRSRTPMRFRSRSPIRRRSPSPMQGRSPSLTRGRSPSPVRRRSPAPLRNRSPLRRRSPSPLRRRSPSPVRRRSRPPLHRRSPSPSRRQSPSPARRRYRRAPSTPRQQSISPVRRRSSMHGRKRSFTPVRRRSLSPQESSSPSQVRPSSLSPVGRASLKSARSPTKFPGERVRSHEKYTPARRASPNERTELAKDREGSTAVERRPVVSLRSPQRDMLARNNLRGKERHLSPIQKSPSVSDASLDKSYSEERRSTSPRRSPYQRREKMVRPESPSALPKTAGPKPRRHSSGTGDDDDNLFTRNRSSAKISPVPVRHKDTLDTLDSAEIGGRPGSTKSRKIQLPNSERLSDRVDQKEHHEQEELSTTRKTTGLGEKGRESYVDAGDRDKVKNKTRVDDSKDGHRFPELEAVPKLSRKSEQNDQNGSFVSASKQTDEPRTKIKEKRKHKKSDRQEVESDDISSYDSYERKESKRKRKEEKKLKKEERRRRREEKRRRRDERHAEKLKSKSVDSGSSSSDLGRDHSEDESVKRRESRASNIQETETERKKLEIELREKALKSLRAKKGIDN